MEVWAVLSTSKRLLKLNATQGRPTLLQVIKIAIDTCRVDQVLMVVEDLLARQISVHHLCLLALFVRAIQRQF